MSAHILIVEDDESIAHMIRTILTIGDYTSTVCADGESALAEILSGAYDLVLLDVMLPKLDGFQVFEGKGKNQTPVIFLTAMGDVSNKVKGLRMGAEDYIVKPFEAVELLARIEVILRRTQLQKTTLRYHNIVIEVEKRLVTLGDEAVDLTPKEFDLLVFFIKNLDVALTRERLYETIWGGYAYECDIRTVDVHVRRLRIKLNLYDSLCTVARFGYRLESRKTF